MPPRKSTVSVASTAQNTTNDAVEDASILSTPANQPTEPKSPTSHKNRQSTSGDAEGEKSEKKKAKSDDLGIDDLLLPRTLTSRLARGTLPPNTSIQRDALLALTKSATVFISYIAHNANNLTSRKTIQSQDILEALRETELWNVQLPAAEGGGRMAGMTLGERVRAEVEKWEDEVKGKRKGYRDRVKARESGAGDEGEPGEEGRGPLAKKARRSSGVDGEGDTTMDADADGDDLDEDPAGAQLRGEAAANDDGTETDPEVAEEEDERDEDVEDDEQDEEEQDEVDGEDEVDPDRIDAEDDDLRRKTTLAPNGRIEVGSDEDSDQD